MSLKIEATVMMKWDKDDPDWLVDCRTLSYTWEGHKDDLMLAKDLTCWAFPGSIISELHKNGFLGGLFGVSAEVELGYDARTSDMTCTRVTYNKFEVR